MNKSQFLPITVYLLAIFCMKPGLSHCQDVTGKWYGTMSMVTISQSQLLGNTTIRVYLTISENVVTGTVEGSSRTIIEGKEVGNASCTGAGTGELWQVAFSKDGNTYEGFGIWYDKKGYPCICLCGKDIKLHIYICERVNGEKPKGFDIHNKDFDKKK